MRVILGILRLGGFLALLGTPAAAQNDPSRACTHVPDSPGGGAAARVHPTTLSERYAREIAARDWTTAIRGYGATIVSTLGDTLEPGKAPSAAYAPVARALRSQATALVNATAAVVSGPRANWAQGLGDAELNQVRPVLDDGRVLLMQRSTGAQVVVPVESLRVEEREALCWSAWSLYRLLQTVNFETVPAALARVEATAGRWTRYQNGGPLQLPHELLLNRLVRPVIGSIGSGRYDPPRFTLTAAHPFAGVELRRTGEGWDNDQGAAVHLTGFTVWFGDWKTNVGASWIAAASGDGKIGQGALLRIGDLVSFGFIDRRRADGQMQRSAIFQLDALRLIASDARAKTRLAALGISGEIFETTPKQKEP
jgi:hypothetical protein